MTICAKNAMEGYGTVQSQSSYLVGSKYLKQLKPYKEGAQPFSLFNIYFRTLFHSGFLQNLSGFTALLITEFLVTVTAETLECSCELGPKACTDLHPIPVTNPSRPAKNPGPPSF